MKILIAHLSDIHLRTKEDVVLARAEAIAKAILSWGTDVELCVLAVTGDVAYSGLKEQYALAREFLGEIVQKIEGAERRLRVVRVAVPGNHDCDFSTVYQAREIILEKFAEDATTTVDSSVIEQCTLPQRAYFAWEADFVTGLELDVSNEGLRNVVTVGKGNERVVLHCCNSAWASSPREKSVLPIPASMAPDARHEATLSISLFHHPYTWMEANSGKEYRRAVERCSDLILTGHEHDPDRVHRTSSAEQTKVTYIEGGLLQDSKTDERSSFNVILVDTGRQQQRCATFEWSHDHYSTGTAPEWECFTKNPARVTSGLVLNEKTEKLLRDPGLTLTDADGVTARLEDFFVFPDLREFTLPGARGNLLDSANLPQIIAEQPSSLLITGDDQSGRTSLGKMLTLKLLERGLVPVFVNGKDLPRRSGKLEDFFADQFLTQYEAADRDVFLQKARDERVLIVDDFHEAVPPKRRSEWLDEMGKVGKLVLIAPEVLLNIEEITRPYSIVLERYIIQPLGHVRRGRLVEKWLSHTAPADQNEAGFVRAVAEVGRTLDTLIGRNFVPAFAPYVLAVLCAHQATTPIDLKASTHGYFYELFIRTSLARGRSSVQFDILSAYLSHFAYSLFVKKRPSVNNTTARALHGEYEEKHDISLDFLATHASLARQGILDISGGEVQFRYHYIYYYFVAAYLRDHITQPGVRIQVTELTQKLHIEENAHILLFLAHLSKDPFIVDEMMKTARSLYKEDVPCRLEDDVITADELQKLGSTMKKFTDGNHEEQRERERQERDAAEEGEDLLPSSASNPESPLVRAEVMLKTIQILGQIAKNFPGSLDGLTKQAIVRECCDLALRALSNVYGMVQKEQVQLLELFAGVIKRAHPGYDEERVIKRAQDTLVSLTSLTAVGIVRRIATSVGSSDLDGTYAKVFRNDVPAERLVYLSLQLDHVGVFPKADVGVMVGDFKSKHLASWVLRALCLSYFRTFPAPLALKQSVCAQLGVAYQQVEQFQDKMLVEPK